MEIEGVVTKVVWVNPHVYVTVLRSDAGGAGESWDLEAQGALELQRAGIERDAIAVGSQIRAAGSPPRSSIREMYVTNIYLPETAEELLLRDSATPVFSDSGIGDRSRERLARGDSSRPELGLFRVWSFTTQSPALFRAEFGVDPDLSGYPLTDRARAALPEELTDVITQNCAPKGMPSIMNNPLPMEFTQSGADIVLRLEEYDTERTIYMDPSSEPPGTLASPLGYSVGRWEEEDTSLVVTTTNISWPYLNTVGVPQSEDSVLVERFTPAADGSRLDYELTVTDPIYLSAPITRTRYWLYLPDERVMPYECTVRN